MKKVPDYEPLYAHVLKETGEELDCNQEVLFREACILAIRDNPDDWAGACVDARVLLYTILRHDGRDLLLLRP